VKQGASDQSEDLVFREPDRAQLRGSDVPPLPACHLRGACVTNFGVGTSFVTHAVSVTPAA
jgi:hypothetical protein